MSFPGKCTPLTGSRSLPGELTQSQVRGSPLANTGLGYVSLARTGVLPQAGLGYAPQAGLGYAPQAGLGYAPMAGLGYAPHGRTEVHYRQDRAHPPPPTALRLLAMRRAVCLLRFLAGGLSSSFPVLILLYF